MKIINEKPSLIIKRENSEPHYEIHYSDRVEFWDLEMKNMIGQSKVYVIRERPDGTMKADDEAINEDINEY